jgi:hypothetical protein
MPQQPKRPVQHGGMEPQRRVMTDVGGQASLDGAKAGHAGEDDEDVAFHP